VRLTPAGRRIVRAAAQPVVKLVVEVPGERSRTLVAKLG
jgi:hypothetical protein